MINTLYKSESDSTETGQAASPSPSPSNDLTVYGEIFTAYSKQPREQKTFPPDSIEAKFIALLPQLVTDFGIESSDCDFRLEMTAKQRKEASKYHALYPLIAVTPLKLSEEWELGKLFIKLTPYAVEREFPPTLNKREVEGDFQFHSPLFDETVYCDTIADVVRFFQNKMLSDNLTTKQRQEINRLKREFAL